MMDREWQAILNKYGQEVAVYSKEEEIAVTVRAFLQPVLKKGEEQKGPSPLGLRQDDRFLYLGPPEVPLVARESLVEWGGRTFEVQNTHPVGLKAAHHWWAILRPRDREVI